MKKELKDFVKWLGENHFTRNSFGIWSTNCSSFKRMDDDEIVDVYINNPDELKNHISGVRKKVAEQFEKDYPQFCN